MLLSPSISAGFPTFKTRTQIVDDMSEEAATLTLRRIVSLLTEARQVTEVCVSPLIPEEVLDAAESATTLGISERRFTDMS